MALFGDTLSDLEDDGPPVSTPPPRDSTTATAPGRAATTSPSITDQPMSPEPGGQDADTTRPVSVSSESTTQQKERRTAVTTGSQPATVTPAVDTGREPVTTTDDIATPTPGSSTNRAALRPDRPPIPIRVRDDLNRVRTVLRGHGFAGV
ncbi:classical arabinogalactan protein 4-like [Solenopsis invicta]|uniref:classical arabinogalactan protein 4-like n=1 Tax=Solenopsis invicta TaxID=13686 RepID=UPI00193C8EBA|nr:classical arabinogalactan protein 4-like [Solenopsis invicta]